jgi:hypothetical protein
VFRSLVFAALALIAVSGRARGQTAGAIIDYETLTKSAVGSWADYTMTFKKSNETKKSRWVIVERAPQRVVLENRMELTVGLAVFRFEYQRAGSDAWKVSAATMKMGSAEPTVIPPDKLASTLVAKSTPIGKLLGMEKVATPAGTFECQHFVKATRMAKEDVVVDVWVSPKATPSGLVKSVIAAKGIEVLLSAVGNDGATKPK